MRRSVLVAALVGALLVGGACSDQPTEINPPTAPIVVPPSAAAAAACSATTLADILTQINQLLPSSPLRASLIALVSALPAKLQQRIQLAVRRQIAPIVDLILKSYNAGKFGPKSAAKQESVFALITSLYCYVGLTPPDLPSGAGGTDVVVAVVFPNSPKTTVAVPSAHAAVTVPSGAAPTGGVTIVVRKLDDTSRPLLTSLDQYPFFYEFSGVSATGPVVFNTDVLAGICLKTGIPVSNANLRLAHNVGPIFGDVEVLPRPAGAVPGLNCSDLTLETGSGDRGLFAWGGWRRMGQTLAPLGRALLPEPLYAASLAVATAGVGGTTKKFSPFGIVDVTSNPGQILFNPNAAAFTGLSAPPGGTVSPAPSVKVTSKNGTPIANVPVVFTVTGGGGTINGNALTTTTVTTGADGVAGLTSWKLGPAAGTNTLTATPPDINSTVGPPPHFAVKFNPTSLTFTATATNPLQLAVSSGDAQTGYTNQILTAPIVVQVTQNGVPVQGAPVTFQAGPGNGSFSPTPVPTNAGGFAESNWTLGAGIGTQTGSVSTPGATSVPLTATATVSPPARIVLQWGASPSDLDAHLTERVDGVVQFHVYYANRGSLTESPFAALDRDDVDSFGPETITIAQQATGEYRFSVHDFINRLAEESSALSESGATVTVYLASGASEVFEVPEGGGTLWTVFTLSGNTITPVNTLSYESSPDNAASFSIVRRGVQALQNDASIIRDAVRSHPK